MAWLPFLLVALAFGAWPSRAETHEVVVGVVRTNAAPFYSVDDSGQGTHGFEVSLKEYICDFFDTFYNTTCVEEPLADSKDRITALQTGAVDLVISRFSAAPKREESVDFIRPFYYASGASLFTTPDQVDVVAQAGWEGLRNMTLCVKTGHYFIEGFLEPSEYTVQKTLSQADNNQEVLLKACVAAVADFYEVFDNLVRVDALPQKMVVPMGMAVQIGNDGLKAKVAGALVQLMSGGDSAPILQFERESIVSERQGALRVLSNLVDGVDDLWCKTNLCAPEVSLVR